MRRSALTRLRTIFSTLDHGLNGLVAGAEGYSPAGCYPWALARSQ